MFSTRRGERRRNGDALGNNAPRPAHLVPCLHIRSYTLQHLLALHKLAVVVGSGDVHSACEPRVRADVDILCVVRVYEVVLRNVGCEDLFDRGEGV